MIFVKRHFFAPNCNLLVSTYFTPPMKRLLLSCVFLLPFTTLAQLLKPGFDKAEYTDLMKISAQFGDSVYARTLPPPPAYRQLYRSPIVGLDNRWDLWAHQTQPVAVVSIRGTTANSVSWLANFYAAMVPAKGEIQLADNNTFSYELAQNPKAAVHVGWLVATGFLAKDMMPKLDSCYRKGIRDVLIIGHSQGGGIAYLLTAYLLNQQKQGRFPADIRLKTYCSAGPKPGNLYFAYDYEAATQNGWAYNVVNTADWVPEVPFTVQTVNDFNTTNPFVNARGLIKKQKFAKRVALKYVYNSLSKPSLKAQRNYQKYLGKLASNTVRKNLNGYVSPDYYNSNHYVRTGTTVVLRATEDYYKLYPDSREKIFVHHYHLPYLYLLERYPDGSGPAGAPLTASLDGTWELSRISVPGATFDNLYSQRKPTLKFDAAAKRFSGNTSCNTLTGMFTLDGPQLLFNNPAAMSRMACPGEGENVFLEALKKVNRYAISNDNRLTLIGGDIALLEFVKK